MNVDIGTEAAQFPQKEYINGIFVAVYIIFLFLLIGNALEYEAYLLKKRASKYIIKF
jgi:hypothetical protein